MLFVCGEMDSNKARKKELARIREKLQELSQLLYWQWILRHSAWRAGEDVMDKAAWYAGERMMQFIRDFRKGEFGWVPYRIAGRAVVIVDSLCIRCELTPAHPEHWRMDVSPAGTEPAQTAVSSVPAQPVPRGWYPAVPPALAHAEPGRWEPRGGRFFD